MHRFLVRALAVLAVAPLALQAQSITLPLAQSKLDAKAADPRYQVPLDSTTDGRWLGGGATLPKWSVDGDWFYFQFALDPKPVEGTAVPDDPWWRVSKDGKRVESVTRIDASRVPGNVQYTKDMSRAMWYSRNELTYWKRGAQPKVLLGRAINNFFPSWSPDQRTIRWVESNSVFEMDPENGALRQLTAAVIQTAPPKADKVKDELKKEQQDLFDFVKRQKAIRDSAARLALVDMPWRPITTPFKEADRLSFIEITPKYVTYMVTPRTPEEQTHYGDYVNEEGVVVDRTSRAKVGAPLAMNKIAIVPANAALHPDSVKITYVDDSTGFGKKVIPVAATWNDQLTHFVVEFQSTDYKDRWISLIDPATGKRIKDLNHDHDDAWFGGPNPAIGWLSPSWIQWLPDGESVAYTSEDTGWNHLYVATMDGKKTALTSGEWEVRGVALSRDETQWWVTAGIEHPDESHAYRVPLRGGAPARVDQLGEGETTPVLSPDQQTIAMRFTSPTQLPDLYVSPVSGNVTPTRVTRAGTDAFWKISWLPSDFVQFPDDKGKPVFARVYKPRVQNPTRAAVMEIHGAGYAQGVHKTFGGSSAHGGRLYAQYLAERGVTYMVLDYRGSAGYGRDMRTDIYRNMGDRDVNSAVAAIPFLEKNYKVSSKNVGLFGCSYGGFFTLMALFKHPGTFQAGAAQCSVTDWAHYNHGYTARILNGAPADDTLAYKVSSPIWHANGLKDKLLLQHGLVDNNVEYQDAVRLVQRMMELGKDFDFVTYPIEAHGWTTRWSKIDSQRRVTKLWEETILKKTVMQ